MSLQDAPRLDPRTFLAKVGPGKTITSYEKRQVVFSQGEPADAVFYIQSGTVLTKVLSSQGKEAIIGMMSAGDFFGEGCLAGQKQRSAGAITMTKCTIIRLEKAAMMRVVLEEPEFSGQFIHYLLSRNRRLEEDLVDQLFNYSETRLARVLIRLANLGKEGKPDRALPKITQATLAEIVGTTRARISFFMNRFRKQGFIEYNPGLRVNSSLQSVLLAAQAPLSASETARRAEASSRLSENAELPWGTEQPKTMVATASAGDDEPPVAVAGRGASS